MTEKRRMPAGAFNLTVFPPSLVLSDSEGQGSGEGSVRMILRGEFFYPFSG
jgi:hypothetical protein